MKVKNVSKENFVIYGEVNNTPIKIKSFEKYQNFVDSNTNDINNVEENLFVTIFLSQKFTISDGSNNLTISFGTFERKNSFTKRYSVNDSIDFFPEKTNKFMFSNTEKTFTKIFEILSDILPKIEGNIEFKLIELQKDNWIDELKVLKEKLQNVTKLKGNILFVENSIFNNSEIIFNSENQIIISNSEFTNSVLNIKNINKISNTKILNSVLTSNFENFSQQKLISESSITNSKLENIVNISNSQILESEIRNINSITNSTLENSKLINVDSNEKNFKIDNSKINSLTYILSKVQVLGVDPGAFFVRSSNIDNLKIFGLQNLQMINSDVSTSKISSEKSKENIKSFILNDSNVSKSNLDFEYKNIQINKSEISNSNIKDFSEILNTKIFDSKIEVNEDFKDKIIKLSNSELQKTTLTNSNFNASTSINSEISNITQIDNSKIVQTKMISKNDIKTTILKLNSNNSNVYFSKDSTFNNLTLKDSEAKNITKILASDINISTIIGNIDEDTVITSAKINNSICEEVLITNCEINYSKVNNVNLSNSTISDCEKISNVKGDKNKFLESIIDNLDVNDSVINHTNLENSVLKKCIINESNIFDSKLERSTFFLSKIIESEFINSATSNCASVEKVKGENILLFDVKHIKNVVGTIIEVFGINLFENVVAKNAKIYFYNYILETKIENSIIKCEFNNLTKNNNFIESSIIKNSIVFETSGRKSTFENLNINNSLIENININDSLIKNTNIKSNEISEINNSEISDVFNWVIDQKLILNEVLIKKIINSIKIKGSILIEKTIINSENVILYNEFDDYIKIKNSIISEDSSIQNNSFINNALIKGNAVIFENCQIDGEISPLEIKTDENKKIFKFSIVDYQKILGPIKKLENEKDVTKQPQPIRTSYFNPQPIFSRRSVKTSEFFIGQKTKRIFNSLNNNDSLLSISGYTKIYEKAKISGSPKISGFVNIYGEAEIVDSPIIYGKINIFDDARISGKAELIKEEVINKYEERYE